MLRFTAKTKEKALTQALGKAFIVLIICMIANRNILFNDILKFFLLFPAAVLGGGAAIYFGENFIFYVTTDFFDDDKEYSPILIFTILLITKFLCLIYLVFLGVWACAVFVPESNIGYLLFLTIVGWYLCHITYADCKKEASGVVKPAQSEEKIYEKESNLGVEKFHNFITKTLCTLGFEILYSEIVPPVSYLLTKRKGYTVFVLSIFNVSSLEFLKRAVDMAYEKSMSIESPSDVEYGYSMLIYPRAFPSELKEYAKDKEKVYLVDGEGLKKLIARGKKKCLTCH